MKKLIGIVITTILMMLIVGCSAPTTSQINDAVDIINDALTIDIDTDKSDDIQTDADNADEGKTDIELDGADLADTAMVEYHFRNDGLLESHFEKHGIEMGFSDKESYEAAASAVINNPKALNKKEKEDNDDVFYLEETNEFVILSTDGYIRTYFYPSAGKAYYDKQ